MPASRFTPLRELEVVVLDTETTGLDVASARLIEIGAVRGPVTALPGGDTHHTLVDPETPIPPASTRVHGIDDARVRDAPTFAAIAGSLWDFLGDRVLVGQSIGFDLAVLWHETRRAGRGWPAPRFLDTKLLASALEPEETELGLDELARRLGVEIGERHSALADAIATAEVFIRLLPRLEQAGIATLGEAIAHANAQHRIRARQTAEGWYDATFLRAQDGFASGAEKKTLARLASVDSFPYRHRVEHVMRRDPLIVPPSTTVRDGARLMDERRLGALLVGDAHARRADGLVSERVVVETVSRLGASGLDAKLEAVMAFPVETLPRDAFVYRALGRMQRLGLSHIAVVDEGARVVGVVSEHRLLIDPASHVVALGDRLSAARSAAQLAQARAELLPLVQALRADGVDAVELADVASFELRELVGQAAALAERRMEGEGAGLPPVPYALLALGDAGRGECLLDPVPLTAIAFESGRPGGVEDAFFAAFAERLDGILAEAGLRATESSVRASLPEWRGDLDTWRERVAGWSGSEPGCELFFDGRLIRGDLALARDLEHVVRATLVRRPELLRALAARTRPPSAEDVAAALARPAFDVDEIALRSLISAARVLALSGGSAARATQARLADVRAIGLVPAPVCDALGEAHAALLRAALAVEMTELAAGRRASRVVELAALDQGALRSLGAALDGVATLAGVLAAVGLDAAAAG